MLDTTILFAWLEFAVRWTHVITAIAWIGSSFYFIALDLGLNRNIKGPADGEEWQVHGGGFYHVQKYLVAPEAMPDHLTWFKWESYSTWLSGAALLVLVYWAGAELYLIDHEHPIPLWMAFAISAGTIVIGWLVYDALCKSPLSTKPTLVMVLLFALIVIVSWGLNQVFTGRAALLHLGAFTATIMTANVFFIIMPNQRIVVADLKAGRTPDAKYGKIAKLRSTHNNYLTLPVIFLMLSNHYPLAFGTEWAWLIAALVFLMGVTIRHYFNTIHAKGPAPNWTILATVLIFFAIAWLSSLRSAEDTYIELSSAAQAHEIIETRCAMCHASEPYWPDMYWPPKGVVLETPADIQRHAQAIYLQSAVSHAMPPGNISGLTEAERNALRVWFKGL